MVKYSFLICLLTVSSLTPGYSAGRTIKADKPHNKSNTSLKKSNTQTSKQTDGDFIELVRPDSHLLGAESEAWAKSPVVQGVYNITYSNHEVIKIAVREYMGTSLVFPKWELIERVRVGDPSSYSTELVNGNTVYVTNKNNVGGDSNITVVGKSGNVYVFYIKTEGFNSKNVTDIKVNIRVPIKPDQPSKDVKENDYLEDVAVDSSKLEFNYDMRGDSSIAPERVYSDGKVTWLDYGNRLDYVYLPQVYKVDNNTDCLVNSSRIGNRILVQDVGDLVLKHNGKFVCITRSK